MIAAIDYSLTSPAMAIQKFRNCYPSFFFQTSKKKVLTKLNKPTIFDICGHLINKNYSDYIERYENLANWFCLFLHQHMIDHVYLEGYAYAATGKVFNIGENTGILKYKLKHADIKLTVVEPSVIKQHATGKGNANKVLMNEAFTEKTGIDLHEYFELSPTDFSPSGDIVDAYFLLDYALNQGDI